MRQRCWLETFLTKPMMKLKIWLRKIWRQLMRCIKLNSSYSEGVESLKYLKLKQMILHLDETIDFMMNNQLSFTDTLIKLKDYEIDMKDIIMVRSMVKVGHFPI